MPQNAYRLNTRTVFLTYPRCDLSLQDLHAALTLIKPFSQHCISQETHEDGGLHLHALLKYDSPINTRNERFFDISTYHPNVQSARDVKAVLKYIRKDGKFIEDWPTKRTYGEIISSATDKESFMDLIKDNQPKDFILHQEKIEYYADKFYQRPTSPYQQIFSPQPWNLPNEITSWLSDEFTKTGNYYNYN